MRRVLREQWVQPEPRVPRVLQVLRVPRVVKVLRELKVRREQLVLRV